MTPDQESADKTEAWECQAEESVLIRLSERVLIKYVPAPVMRDSLASRHRKIHL